MRGNGSGPTCAQSMTTLHHCAPAAVGTCSTLIGWILHTSVRLNSLCTNHLWRPILHFLFSSFILFISFLSSGVWKMSWKLCFTLVSHISRHIMHTKKSSRAISNKHFKARNRHKKIYGNMTTKIKCVSNLTYALPLAASRQLSSCLPKPVFLSTFAMKYLLLNALVKANNIFVLFIVQFPTTLEFVKLCLRLNYFRLTPVPSHYVIICDHCFHFHNIDLFQLFS